MRNQNLETLSDVSRYNLAWLPSVFMPEGVIRRSLPLVFQALAPAGTLIFLIWKTSAGPLPEALASLGVVRMGGHPWRREEVEALLGDNGFTDVEGYNFPEVELTLIAGCKPAEDGRQ